MSHRPSARAALSFIEFLPDDEEILHAKADVCDAYRQWLASTSRHDRGAISAALTELRRLELLRRTPTAH